MPRSGLACLQTCLLPLLLPKRAVAVSQRDSDPTDVMQLGTYTYSHAQGCILELTMVSARRALLHPRGCAGTMSRALCTPPAPTPQLAPNVAPGLERLTMHPEKAPSTLFYSPPPPPCSSPFDGEMPWGWLVPTGFSW